MDIDCRDFRQFPRPGGWHAQDDLEMEAMRTARSAYNVYMKKRNGVKWDLFDAEFVAWLEGDD
jgi:hypothetical protein